MAPIDGYWGKQTATVDWCEENYVVSSYIAEFWNTLSNAVIILAPLFMLIVGYQQNIERRFMYSFLAVTVIGTGSWLFHMTLKYSMQLMDEVPMLWGSTSFIYSSLMVKSKPNEDNVLVQLSLFSMCLFVTLMYLFINAPVFLQVAYGLLNTVVIFSMVKTCLTMECDKRIFLGGVGCYLIGFFFWNVDNIYCHHLKYLKDSQAASGMLFECHAWWHIFSGIGAYLGLLFSLHTRYVYLQRKPRVKLLFGFWPYIVIDNTTAKQK
ncbi:alkaline ceramidase 3 [Biomphalaria pfeifferi]|uniref:Alkaline ceramidase n=1 Tax=Biomphalaria pfeifferi TaxID=112525 RepID=A0AAD8C6G6_BIOPF|nr:alkaline ceramidase 3 [Biomphalaria pfeifferi]